MLAAERERNEARQGEVSSAASALRAAGEEQRAEVAAVKGELRDQKESYRVQVECTSFKFSNLIIFVVSRFHEHCTVPIWY